MSEPTGVHNRNRATSAVQRRTRHQVNLVTEV